ncbi:hypothetical protein BCR36DRAFT_583778, partial [Piromyces finnis]
MFNINDILVDKDATSYVRIESIPNKNNKNFEYRARILATDINTGYPSHLTCACVNLEQNTGYSIDLNCTFQPWINTIKEDNEIKKVENIINKIKNITWEMPTYEYDSEEEVNYEIEEITSKNETEDIKNSLIIKTFKNNLCDENEDDDATLVSNSPQSSIIMDSLNNSIILT